MEDNKADHEQSTTEQMIAALRRSDLTNVERVRIQASALRSGVPFEQVASASRAGRSGTRFPGTGKLQGAGHAS